MTKLYEEGITHLDIVIANAGICPDPTPLMQLDVADVSNAFAVNTVGPILLFQAVRGLLEKSGPGAKWVSMSTGAASLGALEAHKAHGVAAYGISKGGMNWFTLYVVSPLIACVPLCFSQGSGLMGGWL